MSLFELACSTELEWRCSLVFRFELVYSTQFVLVFLSVSRLVFQFEFELG